MAKATGASTYLGREIIRAAAGTTRDVLSAALQENKRYTSDEAAKILKQFMEKEVGGNGGRNMGHTK